MKSFVVLARRHQMLARVHQHMALQYREKEEKMADKDDKNSKFTSDEAFGREPKINTPQAQQKAVADSKNVLGSKGKGK